MEGLEMNQEDEVRDQDQDKGALAGEDLEKEQELEKVQVGEVLEMDQEQGEGGLGEVDLEATEVQYFSLSMPKIQNLSIHRKPKQKDTREKFC